MSMTQIQEDRARLAILQLQTQHEEHRELRRVTLAENFAIGNVLDELHRLNCAIRDAVAQNIALQDARTHDLPTQRSVTPGKKRRTP